MPDANPPPAGFGGSMRRRHATTKKHAFLCVFWGAAITPHVEVYFFVNNFQTRTLVLAIRCNSHQLRLGIAPPTRLGGAMRQSHAIAKKHAFLYVFSRAAKNRNGTIFVNIEGLRPCLSKLSYRAPKWALMVRLMQKERLKSPQKSLL